MGTNERKENRFVSKKLFIGQKILKQDSPQKKITVYKTAMAFQGKLTLRAATTISLHERFTHLKSIKPIPARGPEQQTRAPIPKPRPPSPQEYYVPPPTSHRRATSAPQYHGIFEEDIPRYRRQNNSAVRQERRYLQRNPRPIRPDIAFAAAMKLKQKSIKHRLGQRERHEQPLYYNQQNSYRRFYNGYRERRGGYRGRNRSMNRWPSSQSLASDGMGNRTRRRSGGGWWNRGGRNRRGRGGGGRGGRYQKPKISKEELDAQLDSYMANTKTVLDKDLDDYMTHKA